MRPEALLRRLLGGSVTNVAFVDAERPLRALGFEELRGKCGHIDGSGPQVPSEHRGGQVNAHQYPINVFWSDEDDAWVADLPDLEYCSAFGATPHEAVSEVELAIEAWVDAARANGRSIPSPSVRADRA